MEGVCLTCSKTEGAKLCLVKLKGLFNYEEHKDVIINYALISECHSGRAVQNKQEASLKDFLPVL